MFYQYTPSGLCQVKAEDIDESLPCAGYLTVEELASLSDRFGFDESTVESCRNASRLFRSGVEVHRQYTFTEIRILNLSPAEAEDYVALYIKKNLILIVDIEDRDGSTQEKFLSAVNKDPSSGTCCEKILYAFLDNLLGRDHSALESIGFALAEQEEALLENDDDNDFNLRLLGIKKELTRRYFYYEQLLDITGAVSDNDNGIFDPSNLIYIDNITTKISRLRDDTNVLKSAAEHLQDAYTSYLDIKMNKTMKIFTILTSIFFPLTIIVGWYGMNFQSMPEFTWRFGYLYVIILSVLTVAVLYLIGRRRKWF